MENKINTGWMDILIKHFPEFRHNLELFDEKSMAAISEIVELEKNKWDEDNKELIEHLYKSDNELVNMAKQLVEKDAEIAKLNIGIDRLNNNFNIAEEESVTRIKELEEKIICLKSKLSIP